MVRSREKYNMAKKFFKIFYWLLGIVMVFLLVCYGVWKVRGTPAPPIPKSPLYKYSSYLDRSWKIPPMTDEIVAVFEEQAKKITIAKPNGKHKNRGYWEFISMRKDNATENEYLWLADLDGHLEKSFINGRGEKTWEMHLARILIKTDKKTNIIKSLRVSELHSTKETDGILKETVLFQK